MAVALARAVERDEREVRARAAARAVAAEPEHSRIASHSGRGQHVEDRACAARTAARPSDSPASTSSRRYSATSRSAPPKRASAGARDVVAAERQRGERERGGPALGAVQQRRRPRRGRAGARRRAAAAAASARVIARSRCAQLGHQALGAQARDRQRQLGARGERDRELLRRRAGDRRRASRAPRPTAARWTSSRTSTTRPSRASAEAASTARRDRLQEQRPGSSWRRSSVTQANGRGSRAAHSHSSVVLPNPAGATSTANGGASRSASVATSSVRRTVARSRGLRGVATIASCSVAGKITAVIEPSACTRPPRRGKGARLRIRRGCVHPLVQITG